MNREREPGLFSNLGQIQFSGNCLASETIGKTNACLQTEYNFMVFSKLGVVAHARSPALRQRQEDQELRPDWDTRDPISEK